MTNQVSFDVIAAECREKNVLRLCRKLQKKCFPLSPQRAEDLCHLAYWLFVYGHRTQALSVCASTHDEPFPGRYKYNVWSFILPLWGLETYLLQEEGNEADAKMRIQAMDDIWLTPTNPDTSLEICQAREIKRRSRFKYEDVLETEKISSWEDDEKLADRYRFTALFHMVGYGATGLFPDLSAHWPELKEDIAEYTALLAAKAKTE